MSAVGRPRPIGDARERGVGGVEVERHVAAEEVVGVEQCRAARSASVTAGCVPPRP